LARIAEQAREAWIDCRDAPLRIKQYDGVGKAVEEGLESQGEVARGHVGIVPPAQRVGTKLSGQPCGDEIRTPYDS
jgi:hypothetical protein